MIEKGLPGTLSRWLCFSEASIPAKRILCYRFDLLTTIKSTAPILCRKIPEKLLVIPAFSIIHNYCG
ncbi:hypothetical protein SAMN05216403_12537 [Nitrosospira multiformis ATCC 25196]|uniref:Uncharacterized protein n=1 Tax=Nitrosospira multiformis (strain ATCC 25196 / NCIMB 11849 / C 71) TaxID=323848 RepID=A0A1H5X0J5_NITMU|nr:hypothetical protein SAMN05216403_12537 [Nitrosospira multiformis ATCC 25196]